MRRRVIVITIEGLPTSLLGPYGSNTAVTPVLNAMAARGIVLDQCTLDSRDTSEMLRSLWTAQHALTEHRDSSQTHWNLLAESGGLGALLTDCERTAELADELGCEEVYLADMAEVTKPADELTGCAIVSLLSQAADMILRSAEDPALETHHYWVHSRGLRLPWDAPTELRNPFADADEPEPPQEIGPPAIQVTRETDPDLVVGWGQVAAAQVAALDQAIEWLSDFVHQLGDGWAWCIIGLGGVPLGEHGWVGWGTPQLFSEEIQVPAMIVPNPELPVGTRRAELSQLPDLGATIAELCGLTWPKPIWGRSMLEPPSDKVPMEWLPADGLVGLVDGPQTLVRVPAWNWILDSEGREQLYVKPDDRWDANDVSMRCSEIVGTMRELAAQFVAAAKAGNRDALPVLDELLCNLLR